MVREYCRESFHFGRGERTQRLSPNIAENISGQHGDSCLVVWWLENTYVIVMTECSTFALILTPLDCPFAGLSYSLSRLLRSVNFLIGDWTRMSDTEMEARGVEPLSSSLSAQTSTRLSGEKF